MVIDKLIDIETAAAYLDINKFTMYKYAKAGRVPCIKLGGSVKFRESDISEIIINGLPEAEPQRKASRKRTVTKTKAKVWPWEKEPASTQA